MHQSVIRIGPAPLQAQQTSVIYKVATQSIPQDYPPPAPPIKSSPAVSTTVTNTYPVMDATVASSVKGEPELNIGKTNIYSSTGKINSKSSISSFKNEANGPRGRLETFFCNASILKGFMRLWKDFFTWKSLLFFRNTIVDYLSSLIKHTLYRTQYDNPILVENVHDLVMTSNKSLSFIHFLWLEIKIFIGKMEKYWHTIDIRLLIIQFFFFKKWL